MKIIFIICMAIILFSVFTYDKWSYKAWYERCVRKGNGYDIDGNYYDHNKGLVYYRDGSVEKIDCQNLNKNRRKHKLINNKSDNSNKNEFPSDLQSDPSASEFRYW